MPFLIQIKTVLAQLWSDELSLQYDLTGVLREASQSIAIASFVPRNKAALTAATTARTGSAN